MTALILWLMTGAGKVVAGIITAAFVGLAVYAKGRSSARRDARLDAAEDNIATRRRMDDAEAATGDDPAVLRDWLRERGQRPGDL